jgi:hypothetical protein
MTYSINQILNGYLLSGVADLLATLRKSGNLLTGQISKKMSNSGQVVEALIIDDYSLSIEDHAAQIRREISSSLYLVSVDKNSIRITAK